MKKKHILIFLLIALVLVIVAGIYPMKEKTGPESSENESTQVVSTYEPLDIVLDFYGDWLEALRSTSTDPYVAGLANEPLLSSALREKLNSTSSEQVKDLVLCQDPLPEKIRSKVLYENPDEVQMVVFSKEQSLAGQSVATVRKLNEGWYIYDISCSKEFDEPGEFSFEQEGNLLKQSMPAPYNPEEWHLIFEQNGTGGYVAQLLFDGETMCTDLSGTESVCDTNQFTETQKVMVRGNMTESGVDVVRVESIE